MRKPVIVIRAYAAALAVMGLLLSPATVSAAATPEPELRAAMEWLTAPWSDEKEQALEAQEAKAAGPGYFTTPLSVPGSSQHYTRKQLNSGPPDWWPQDHPPMPAIVGVGVGKAWPCAACHLPDGVGIPSSASLTGLPEAYIVEQVKAFRSGTRLNQDMQGVAPTVTDADLQAAAAYFASLKLTSPRAQVVEAAQVPVTHAETWLRIPTPGAGSQAIGHRIIEIPEDVSQAKWQDSRAHFIAYVPPGSLAAGRQLAETGTGRTQACATCHGGGLKGGGPGPAIAGRSPTYLARQLVAFAIGDRSGPASAPMQAVVAHLSLDDMIDLAAYAGSLPP